MKYIKVVLSIAMLSALCACSSGDSSSLSEEAKATPIGSVLDGKTTTTESYIKKVEEGNRSLDKDVWRPQSKDRF